MGSTGAFPVSGQPAPGSNLKRPTSLTQTYLYMPHGISHDAQFLFSLIQFNSIQFSSVQFGPVQSSPVQFSSIPFHSHRLCIFSVLGLMRKTKISKTWVLVFRELGRVKLFHEAGHGIMVVTMLSGCEGIPFNLEHQESPSREDKCFSDFKQHQ